MSEDKTKKSIFKNLFSKLKKKKDKKTKNEVVSNDLNLDQTKKIPLPPKPKKNPFGFLKKLKKKKVQDPVKEEESSVGDITATQELNINQIQDETPLPELETEIEPKPKSKFAFSRFLKSKKPNQSKPKKVKKVKPVSSEATLVNILKNINNPNFRPDIHKAFIVALMTTFLYTAGKLTAVFLAQKDIAPIPSPISIGSSKTFDPTDEMNKIKIANLFNARRDSIDKIQKKPEKKKPVIAGPCLKSNKKSSLPLKLISTIVLQDSVKSLASVQVRSNRDISHFRENEKINTLAEIHKIENLKVIFRNLQSKECEYIANSKYVKPVRSQFKVHSPSEGAHLLTKNQTRGIKQDGTNFSVCKSFLNEKLQDIGNILTQAKADPFPNPDGTLAFKISQVKPGGVFSHLGIQLGDVIQQINGNKINNIQEVMNLFSNMKSMSQLQLVVERNGIDMSLDYSFDGSKDCK